MPDKLILAQQFVENYPQAAARALEELTTSTAASFIDTVPDKNSARLLASMLPYYAAKCVSYLSADAAGRYLGDLEPRAIANILRHTPEETRLVVLSKLPHHLRTRVAIILNYSQAMVGAWIEPTVLALPLNRTVGEAKSRLGEEAYVDFHRLYVLSEDHRVVGFVRLSDLFRYPDYSSLSDCLEPIAQTLRASTSLDRAIEDNFWTETDYIPVVDRRDRFLGVLRYADLRRAQSRPRSAAAAEGDISSGFMDLAESCYLGMANVMNTSLAIEHDFEQEEAR